MEWFENQIETFDLKLTVNTLDLKGLRKGAWRLYCLMRSWERDEHFKRYPHSRKKLAGPFRKRKMKK